MDPFSYLVVLTSIVLGLGVTRLVAGLVCASVDCGICPPTALSCQPGGTFYDL